MSTDRSLIDLDLAQLDAEVAQAIVPPCPEWCDRRDDHPWSGGTREDSIMASRTHRRRDDFGIEVVVNESLHWDGSAVSDGAVMVDPDGPLGALTPDLAAEYAKAMVSAVEFARSLMVDRAAP